MSNRFGIITKSEFPTFDLQNEGQGHLLFLMEFDSLMSLVDVQTHTKMTLLNSAVFGAIGKKVTVRP